MGGLRTLGNCEEQTIGEAEDYCQHNPVTSAIGDVCGSAKWCLRTGSQDP